ncbi:hypothetical protein ACF0H5_018424 [Mactra antiquata]
MKRIFDEVQLSFLIVGHTHEDIDSAFSTISRKLRAIDAETVSDLISIIENFEMLKCVFDVKSWMSPNLNELSGISKPLHFKITGASVLVESFYKGQSNDVWIKLDKNILIEVPRGKPEFILPDFTKIDHEKNLRQIQAMKNFFSRQESYLVYLLISTVILEITKDKFLWKEQPG